MLQEAIGGRSEAGLLTEIAQLRTELKQAQQNVELLQEALGFFAKRRR